MDPVLRLWYYYHWIADQEEKMEAEKNHAYLIGSFFNPAGVKSLTDKATHTSTDEEFEESLDIVRQYSSISLDPNKPKRRTRPKRE